MLAVAAIAAGALGAFIYLQRTEPPWWARLWYPLRYASVVRGHAANYHLNPALLAAVIEQVYSIMQTNTSRGMQTMEQALADLTLRRVINVDEALARTSRPDQLAGLLERSGLDVTGALAALELNTVPAQQPGATLRVAGS